MFSNFIRLFLICIFFNSALPYKTYEGFKLLEVDFKDARSKRHIQNLENHLGFMPDYLGENWKMKQAHYFIDKDSIEKVKSHFDKERMNYTLRDMNPTFYKIRRRRDLNSIIGINDINNRYLSYDEQMQYLNNLHRQYPGMITLQSLGNSYEGRQIMSVRISDNGSNKPIVWIDAGIHAREWISYNVAFYLIHMLVTDPSYRSLLDSVQVVVVPNTNPDGYEYSRNSERMWRKTRSRYTSSRCAGADANRNYPFYWGTQGVSHSPCNEIFCGTRPQSEPEVLALTNAIQREETRIKGYVALHSYGQEILYPWGHTVHTYPSDVDDLIRVGKMMASAIRAVNNTEYNVINSGDGLYPAAGASDDWAKSRGIKYAFTMELSPLDDYTGFALPEDRIFQVNQEAFQGLLTLIQEVAREFSTPNYRQQIPGQSKLRGFPRLRGFGRG